MKKSIFLTAIVMLLSVATSYAQDVYIFGGLNVSMIQEKIGGEVLSDEYDNLLGPNGGIRVAIPTKADNYFETGLFLSNKGFKMRMEEYIDGEKVEADASVTLYYLEAPLNFKSTMQADHNIRLYFNYGVFIGVGVAGKIKVKASAMGETVTSSMDIEWGSDPDEDYFIPIDLGVNMGAGLEFGRVLVGLNYSYGLLNISSYTQNDYKNRSRAFSIMLGYKFPSKKTDPLTEPKQYL